MEKLFLLEVLVENVEIDYTKVDVDKKILDSAKQICIKIQFLSFPELTICEEDFSPTMHGDYHKSNINIKSGKSCLFSIRKWNVQDRSMPLLVTVIRTNPEPPHVPIGKACINLGSSFTNILAAAQTTENTETITKKCTDVYVLQNNSGTDVGKIRMFVRLTCFGPLIVTQFQISGDENNSFLFRGNDGSGIVTFNRNHGGDAEKPGASSTKKDPCESEPKRPPDCPPCPPNPPCPPCPPYPCLPCVPYPPCPPGWVATQGMPGAGQGMMPDSGTSTPPWGPQQVMPGSGPGAPPWGAQQQVMPGSGPGVPPWGAQQQVMPGSGTSTPPWGAQQVMPGSGPGAPPWGAQQQVMPGSGTSTPPWGGQSAMPGSGPGMYQHSGGQGAPFQQPFLPPGGTPDFESGISMKQPGSPPMMTPDGVFWTVNDDGQGMIPGGGEGIMPGDGQGMMQNGGQMMAGDGQGMIPGGGQGMMQSGGQVMMHSGGQGMMPDGGQGMIVGGGQGMMPGSGQGMIIGGGQGMTPGSGQGITTAGGQMMPGGGQGVMPVGGQTMPSGGQGMVPSGGPGMIPGNGQGMMPGAGQRMPNGGQGMMQGGGQMPGGGHGAIPGGGQMIPGGGQMMPGGGQMMPGGGQMMPGGGQMMPGGGQMMPVGGLGMMPGGGQMMPGGGQMMPGGGLGMMPGGEQTDLDYKEFGAEVNGHSLSIKVLRKPRKPPKIKPPLPICGHIPIGKKSSSSSSEEEIQPVQTGIQFCECDFPLPPGFTKNGYLQGSSTSKKKKKKKDKNNLVKCPFTGFACGDPFRNNCMGLPTQKNAKVLEATDKLRNPQPLNKQIGMLGEIQNNQKATSKNTDEQIHTSGNPTFILNIPPKVFPIEEQPFETPFQSEKAKSKKVFDSSTQYNEKDGIPPDKQPIDAKDKKMVTAEDNVKTPKKAKNKKGKPKKKKK